MKNTYKIVLICGILTISALIVYFYRPDQNIDITDTVYHQPQEKLFNYSPDKTDNCKKISVNTIVDRYDCNNFNFELPKDYNVKVYNDGYKIISDSDLVKFESPSYTDQPLGFDLMVYTPIEKTSLDNWLLKFLGVNSLDAGSIDKDEARVPVLEIKMNTIQNSDGYLIRQLGVGDGDYVQYFKIDDKVFSLANYNKTDFNSAVYKNLLITINTK